MNAIDIITHAMRPIRLPVIYPGLVASLITRALNGGKEAVVDQHQANGAYGVHQLRVRLPNDPTRYRVIIAPADAPICAACWLGRFQRRTIPLDLAERAIRDGRSALYGIDRRGGDARTRRLLVACGRGQADRR